MVDRVAPNAQRPVPLAQRHLWKVPKVDDRKQRHRVAVVAGVIALVFLALSLACLLTHRALLPIPFGSHLLVELAMQFWPDAWYLAALHNLIIAFVAAMFVVSVTISHVELPSHPDHPDTLVWRRQSRWCVLPSLLMCLALGAAGAGLHLHNFIVAGAVLESLAAPFAIRSAAIWWVPNARIGLVIQKDDNDGIGNHWTLTGGSLFWWRLNKVVLHWDAEPVQEATSFLEFVCGCSGMFISGLKIPFLAAAQVVQGLVAFINARLLVARGPDAMKSPWGQFPVTGWGRRPNPPPAR